MERSASIWRGLVAGAIGGILGAVAMSGFFSVCEKLGRVEQNGDDSTLKTASLVSERVLHRPLTEREKGWAGSAVHYSFGAVVGGLYGALSELICVVSIGWGLPFGAAVWLGAHVIAVPAAGLGQPITRSRASYEIVEFIAHLFYGAVVEATRRVMRSGHL
jgi:putative membrane protein